MKTTINVRSKILIDTYQKWIKAGDSVLDIGVGNGVMAWNIQKGLKCKITGTDVLKYIETPIKFTKMKGLDQLPFKNNEFDIAMLNGVLHHIDTANQPKVILEAFRVSKNLLIFDDQPSFRSKWICFVLNKIHEPRMYLPATFRTSKEWKKMFKSLKLEYKFKEAKLPWWYPLPHFGFKVWKRKR